MCSRRYARGVIVSVSLAVAVAFGACAEPDDLDATSIGHLTQAVGEPQSGFPNWEERLVFVLTNRARADPAAEVAATCTTTSCATYPTSKALVHDHNLARASRFHAASLLKSGSGLMHDSVCELVANLGSIYPALCDGSPSCACVGGAASCTCSGTKPYCTAPGGLTSTWNRIKRFGTSGTGENAAAGNYDPIKTFAQWVKSSGHWSNVNKASHSRLGVGHFGDTGGCWKDFWVQAFGGGTITIPKIPGGAHHPKSGGTTTQIAFWANYYDPAGAKPQLATVNVNGTCYKMNVDRGTDTHGSYHVAQAFASAGCHKYYFYFRDSTGAVVTYPTTGSYGLSVGGTACGDYHASARPSPGTGCGGCSTNADCNDSSPCTTDSCVSNKCQNTAIAGCCTTAAQCGDGDPCTKDACTANKCTHSPIASCCKANADCNDSDACTSDTCVSNACQNKAIAGCCKTAAQCNDNNPCSADTCSANTCGHSTISGCCTKNADCDDGSDCTADTCSANTCTFSPISGCCTKDADCADTNPCTMETCTVPPGNCTIKTISDCCAVDTDCADTNPCTADTCDTTDNTCSYASIPGPGCTPAGDSGSGPGPDAGGSSSDGGIVRIPPGSGNDPNANVLNGGCNMSGGPPPMLLWLLLALPLVLRRRR
jgi:uncharacterized protein (TIGR03382 family)